MVLCSVVNSRGLPTLSPCPRMTITLFMSFKPSFFLKGSSFLPPTIMAICSLPAKQWSAPVSGKILKFFPLIFIGNIIPLCSCCVGRWSWRLIIRIFGCVLYWPFVQALCTLFTGDEVITLWTVSSVGFCLLMLENWAFFTSELSAVFAITVQI